MWSLSHLGLLLAALAIASGDPVPAAIQTPRQKEFMKKIAAQAKVRLYT